MATVIWQAAPTANTTTTRPDRRAATGPRTTDAATVVQMVGAGDEVWRDTVPWALRLLPRARREALWALCAFWRAVHDIAEGDATPARKYQLLTDWRYQVTLLFDGRPQHPVTRALAGAVRSCELRRDDFLAVIDGKLRDAQTTVQAPSLIELDVHCAQVAVAIGRLTIRILGLTTPIADRAASELGRAMRLTAILRDLDTDAARQRLYLPGDVLRTHGIAERDPHIVLDHPALPWVCDVVARRAERHFADAAHLMARLPRRNLRATAVLLACQRALLHAVVTRGWHCLEQPVQPSRWRTAGLLLRFALIGR
jgi:phytoene/squalene synthetase